MRTGILRRVGVVSALVLTLVVGGATAASARTTSGGCHHWLYQSYTGTGYVDYTYDGVYDRIYGFRWTINGQSGSTQNQVRLSVRVERSGPDHTAYAHSYSNLRTGNGGAPVENGQLYIGAANRWYGHFTFIFDRNNAPDIDCGADTAKV